jgi:hypothetical protein
MYCLSYIENLNAFLKERPEFILKCGYANNDTRLRCNYTEEEYREFLSVVDNNDDVDSSAIIWFTNGTFAMHSIIHSKTGKVHWGYEMNVCIPQDLLNA